MRNFGLSRLFLISATFAASSAFAADGTWVSDGGGKWSATAGWSGGIVADGSSSTANFTNDITADRTVTLDSPRTLTNLVFGDADTTTPGSWLLTGSTLTLAGATPTITVNALGAGKSAAIASILAGSAGLTKSGAGTLVLTGANTYTGGTTIGAGTLQLGDGVTDGTLNGVFTTSSGATLRFLRATTATAPAWANIQGAGVFSLATNRANSGTANDWGQAALTTAFTGTFQIERGRVYTNGVASLGNAAAVIVQSGGQLGMWNGGVFNQNFTIAGTGYGEAGYESALRLGNTGVATTINGTITLAGNATIGASNSGSNSAVSALAGAIGDSGSGYGLTFGTSSGSSGIYLLSAANTFSGATTIAYGTLRLGNTSALGSSTLNYSSGALAFDASVASNAFTLGGLSGSSNIALQNNAATPAAVALSIGNNNANTAYSGVLSGPGSLIKIGTGILTLSGANTFTGTTTVSAGTLNVTGGLTSGITVNSGATLSGTGVTTGSLTLSAGSTLVGAAGTAAATNGTAFTVGDLNTGAGGIKVTGTLSASGLLDIVRYTGTWTGGASDFDLSAYRAPTAITQVSGATGTKLQFGVTRQTDVWAATTGTWDNAHGVGVWTNGADNAYYALDDVQFNDLSGQTTATVTVSDQVTPNTVTFGNSATHYTLTGAGGITGTTTLVKTGTGVATLNTTNTYTGNTTITAGTLEIGGAGTLGGGGYAGNIANAGTLLFSTSANQTLSGVISGAGALTLSGTGTLTLSGANTQTGGITVSAGTLILTGANAQAAGATISSGGTLQIGNGGTTGNLAGAIVNNGALVYNFGATTVALNAAGITGSGTVNVTAQTVQFNGNITGGNQSYTATGFGNNQGMQVLGSIVNLTATGGAGISLTGSLGHTNSGGAGSTLNLDTSSGNGAINLNIAIGQNNVLYPVSAFNANAGTGAITVGGSNPAAGWSAATASLTGAISISGNLSNSGALTLNTTGLSAATASISGSGSLIKVGANTLTLFAANTYTGTTTVNAGTLQFAKANAFYNSASGAVTGVNGAKLIVNTGGVAAFNVGAATAEFTATDITTLLGASTGAVGFKTGATLALDTTNAVGGNFTYAANLANPAGSASLGLMKLGAGTLTLSGANTHTGGTTVSAGNLTVAATTGAIQVGAAGVTVAAGATLTVNGTLNLTSASATIANAGVITGTGVINIGTLFDGDGTTHSYTLIAGTGALGGANFTVTGFANYSSVTFDNTTGNLVFIAVPEPGTYGLVGAGTLALAAACHRRRKRTGRVA